MKNHDPQTELELIAMGCIIVALILGLIILRLILN